ncbi:DEAD/DEAH box helicase [Halomonas salina]|uniref:DEAD/DEAH box helicase n=1 Tax=Halomonas salina TaxID=42565 RepID=UPI0009DF8BA0|nr:DEAD/DEAH box helicase family protein [Halomonas salina]
MSDIDEVKKKLRVCQKYAVDVMADYLNIPDKELSCLISMPTGSGKTGVIAAGCLLKENKKCLVLCNRSAVKEQLIEQLGGVFINDVLEIEIETRLKARELIEEPQEDVIYVATFQRLTALPEVELQKLYHQFELVIIDEGHAEPAPKWSKISRGFDAHKIIITATPYRNDLFQFNIDAKHTFVYTFGEAVDSGDIVNPEFVRLDGLEKVIALVKKELEKKPNAKCIIKCKNYDEVESYRKRLGDVFDTSAYHDKYTGKSKPEKTASLVPKNIKKLGCEVVVHQKKLDEGVDIPQSKILVLTYPVASGRELVQSVGRVVRKYEGYSPTVIDMTAGSNVRVWENYQKFDEYLGVESNKLRFIRSLDTSKLLESYVDEFPEYSYFESGFKKRIDFNEIDPSVDINIPRVSVCFIEKGGDFSIQAFCNSIELRASREGELVRVKECSESLYVIMYIAFNNSPFLKEGFFFEPSLELTIVKESNGFIAVYDSRSLDYSDDEELSTLAAVAAEKIHSLSGKTPFPRTEEVHTRVIGSARRRPEATSYRDYNLERVPQTQANSNSAITRMVVANLNKMEEVESRYYIGSRSGRVADQNKRNFSLNEFEEWVDDISSWINQGMSSNSLVVNSYAKPITTAPNGKALSVVFDFGIFDSSLVLHNGVVEDELHPGFFYCKVSGSEVVVGGGKKVRLSINIDDKNELSFSSSNDWFFKDGSMEGRNFVESLNYNQQFKVLFEDGVTYLNGGFYKVALPTENGISIEGTKLGRCFVGIGELKKEGLVEKGKLINDDKFSGNSIFGLIDSVRYHADVSKTIQDMGPFYQYLHNPDIVLCTDMGTEPADFILASEEKICFVHVKCGSAAKSPRSSAGGLAEVAGQAMKNIEYLISKDNELLPGNMTLLRQPWSTSESGGSLTHRVRLLFGESPDVYMRNNKIKCNGDLIDIAFEEIKKRRASDAVDKEIWVVVGNSFSKKSFFENIKKGKKASAESLQAYQLIDGFCSTAYSHDVGIKFFVSP